MQGIVFRKEKKKEERKGKKEKRKISISPSVFLGSLLLCDFGGNLVHCELWIEMVGSTGDLPLDLFAIFEEGKKKERGSSFTFQHDFRFDFHFNQSINQSIMMIIIFVLCVCVCECHLVLQSTLRGLSNKSEENNCFMKWRAPNPVAQPDLSASVSSLAIHHHVCQDTLATPTAQQAGTKAAGSNSSNGGL